METNGPFELTFDEEQGVYWLNDQRDSSWTASLGNCTREEAEQYRDDANKYGVF